MYWFILLLLLAGCTTSYPYLILNENCRCEHYVYDDQRSKIRIELSASYQVRGVVISTLKLSFFNRSNDTLSLKQGYIKAASQNIQYPNNNRFQPLPHVELMPGERYDVEVGGSDTDQKSDPWLKIAGEKVTVELRRLMVGGKELQPIVFTLVPLNPKLPS